MIQQAMFGRFRLNNMRLLHPDPRRLHRDNLAFRCPDLWLSLSHPLPASAGFRAGIEQPAASPKADGVLIGGSLTFLAENLLLDSLLLQGSRNTTPTARASTLLLHNMFFLLHPFLCSEWWK